MEIVVSNIDQFKVFFETVRDDASEEIELQLFPDRMVCVLLDRSHSRFFQVVFNEEFFDSYVIDDVSSVTVNMEDMYTVFKSCSKKDSLILSIDDPHMIVKIVSDTGNSRIFEFVLPTNFVDSPTPPKLDLPVKMDVDVGDLKQSAKDINLLGSDQYRLTVDNDTLLVSTSEDIATNYANTVSIEDQSTTVSSRFSLDYISQMLKFDKINKTVELRMGSDMPLIYSYKDMIMGVNITGMIAPLMSEED